MKKPIAAMAVVAVFAGAALAQTQAPRESAPGQQGANLDRHIAACMLLANQEEVALAEFAKEKCEGEKCKQFAQKMIEMHQQAIAKIEEAAPELASLNLKLRNAKGAGGEGEQPSASEQAGGAQGLDPTLLLTRQVKEECLALTQQALSEKQGAEFDKAYIHQQCGAHLAMKAGLKGSEPFASEQLKPVIQEGLKMTEEHLKEAKSLAKQMKDSKPREVAAADPAERASRE
jgi:predicted outer membrane protein